MIIKIQPPSSKMSQTIGYNEKKATGEEGIRNEVIDDNEKGHIVQTMNVPDNSTMEKEFDRLKTLNIKTGKKVENNVFHMSINPGKDDNPLSEEKTVEFIKEIMEKLGYGEVPYRIYKHTDIDRPHYHVVSTRIGLDGRKIKDSFENRRVNNIGKSLEKKYGYTIGNKPEEKQEIKPQSKQKSQDDKDIKWAKKTPEKAKEKQKKTKVPPFNQSSNIDFKEQYENIHKDALTWTFTTINQYQELLKFRYRVETEEYADQLYYAGLNKKKEVCTNPLSETEIGINALREIQDKINNTKIREKKRQRERLENFIEEYSKSSKSWEDMQRKLSEKGIYVILHWTDQNKLFGVTYIDIATKCIFKASDTDKDLKYIVNLIKDKNWSLQKKNTLLVKVVRTNTTKRYVPKTSVLQTMIYNLSKLRSSAIILEQPKDDDDDDELNQKL